MPTIDVTPTRIAGTIAPPEPWQIGRVYRCAWCRRAAAVPDGLPYYTYRADGARVEAAPADWSGSDGICPAHWANVLDRRRSGRAPSAPGSDPAGGPRSAWRPRSDPVQPEDAQVRARVGRAIQVVEDLAHDLSIQRRQLLPAPVAE